LPFYKKAAIPTITEKKVEEKIISLATLNAKLRAIPVGRRNSESSRKLLDEEKRLRTTFAIWPADVENRLVHEHDVLFLNSMKTDRQITMGSCDNKLRKKANRKAERESTNS